MIIGCVVNGPGEAAQTEIGLTEAVKTTIFYISQEFHTKVPSSEIINKVVKLVEDKKKKKIIYGSNRKNKRYYIKV